MASSPQVIGPCLVHAGVGGSLAAKKPVFFGTCEDSPQVQISHQWEPLFNALGGCRLPSDQSYQGENATIRLDLTRWQEVVRQAVSAAPYPGGIAGFHPFGHLGALMKTEGAYFPLWLQFPYAVTQPAMQAAGMVLGYRFLACRMETDDLGPLSPRPRKVSIVVSAEPLFDSRTLAWKLYDHNMAGVPTFS